MILYAIIIENCENSSYNSNDSSYDFHDTSSGSTIHPYGMRSFDMLSGNAVVTAHPATTDV